MRDRATATFADLAADVPDRGELTSYEVPNPIRDGRFRDAEGTWWTRRPWHRITVRKLERLVLDPTITVIELCQLDSRSIAAAEREAYSQVIGPDPRRAVVPGCDVGDFRDQRGNRIILVQVYL